MAIDRNKLWQGEVSTKKLAPHKECLALAYQHYLHDATPARLSDIMKEHDITVDVIQRAIPILFEISGTSPDTLTIQNDDYEGLCKIIISKLDIILDPNRQENIAGCITTKNGHIKLSGINKRTGEVVKGDVSTTTTQDFDRHQKSKIESSLQIRMLYKAIGWKNFAETKLTPRNHTNDSVYKSTPARLKIYYYSILSAKGMGFEEIADEIQKNYLIALKLSSRTRDNFDIAAFIQEELKERTHASVADGISTYPQKYITAPHQKGTIDYYSPTAQELLPRFLKILKWSQSKFFTFENLQALCDISYKNHCGRELIFNKIHELIEKKNAELKEKYGNLLTEDEIRAYVKDYYISASKKPEPSSFGFSARTMQGAMVVKVYPSAVADVIKSLAELFPEKEITREALKAATAKRRRRSTYSIHPQSSLSR